MTKYDRELIARMLGALASFPERLTGFKVESVAEQSRLLREAENLEADARTVVRDERLESVYLAGIERGRLEASGEKGVG